MRHLLKYCIRVVFFYTLALAFVTLVCGAPVNRQLDAVTDDDLQGSWLCEWGSCRQDMFFDKNFGLYGCSIYGGGPHKVSRNSVVDFTEGTGKLTQDGEQLSLSDYRMVLKKDSYGGFTGQGWRLNDHGEVCGSPVTVRIYRKSAKID